MVGGTSRDTTMAICGLPSVTTVAQFARMRPTSPNPMVSELDTTGFCSKDGS